MIMPQSRKSQISLADTPYYHCVSRCVRKAFLCGKDKTTGKCYEHRRQWVENKILFLAQVFSIEVCAYAVMSNHTHIVLCVDEKSASQWTALEVLSRWHKLFKGTLLTQQYVNGEKMTEIEKQTVEDTIAVYRDRLFNISWFMRVLNEDIAREANKEDNCTGRFWEGRFKSQALLDDSALIACMTYVDLNPVRAKLATAAKDSAYTSIRKRLKAARGNEQPSSLKPFALNGKIEEKSEINFELKDYLELIEFNSCAVRGERFTEAKSVHLKAFDKLLISEKNWLVMSLCFELTFRGAVGKIECLRSYSSRQGRHRVTNLSACKRLYR